jgi:hypothetical protein
MPPTRLDTMVPHDIHVLYFVPNRRSRGRRSRGHELPLSTIKGKLLHSVETPIGANGGSIG